MIYQTLTQTQFKWKNCQNFNFTSLKNKIFEKNLILTQFNWKKGNSNRPSAEKLQIALLSTKLIPLLNIRYSTVPFNTECHIEYSKISHI
jgi:hypothetical protein